MDNINEMPTWVSKVFVLLSGGGLGLFTKLGYDLYMGKRKANQDDIKTQSDTKISEDKAASDIRQSEQALNFKALRGIVEETQSELATVKEDMKKVQGEHLQAREQVAELKMENRYIKQERDNLVVQINELKAEIIKLKSR